MKNRDLDRQLIDALIIGKLDLVRHLIKDGANIHANDDKALRYASSCGHLNLVKEFVEKGANVHAKNDEALRWSAANNKLEIVKYLISKGADIHALGEYALIHASSSEMVEYLISEMDPEYVISKLPKFIKYITNPNYSHVTMMDKYGIFV
jgi:ankyrin repeat protein